MEQGHALVTGGSQGIGFHLADQLAGRGWSPILVARSAGKLETAADKIRNARNVEVRTLSQDLAQPDAAQRLIERIEDVAVQIDVLVNNAGKGLHGGFEEAGHGELAELVHLNITTPTLLMRHYLESMKRRDDGWILNVASTAAFQPGPLMAAYYASKSYVLNLSQAVTREVKQTGVSVSVLCPGPTRTEFQERANMGRIPVNFDVFKMRPEKVAATGVEGLMDGKRVIIPGFTNKVFSTIARLSPRRLTNRVVRRLHE